MPKHTQPGLSSPGFSGPSFRRAVIWSNHDFMSPWATCAKGGALTMSPKPFGTALSMGTVLMPAIPWRCPQGSFPRKRLRGQGQRRSWIAGQSSGSLVIISAHPASLSHAVKDQHLGLQGTPGGGGGRAALCLHCGESEMSETSHSHTGQVYESPLAPADPPAGRSCPLRAWPDITLCLVLPFPSLLPPFRLQSS